MRSLSPNVTAALLSAEWLQADARRTALGLDIDREAMLWGLRNNFAKLPDRAKGRLLLLEGNVLDPITAAKEVSLPTTPAMTSTEASVSPPPPPETDAAEASLSLSRLADISCAFNFSTCCLHSRKQLLQYFRRAYHGLSPQGGVFVADLYGGWTVPDLRECLLEAGFEATHVWMRESRGPQQRGAGEGNSGSDDDGQDDNKQEGLNEFEEVESFAQCDSWNAYVVGVRTAAQAE
eukprot:jgi/Chlat1/5229/Chrsp33S00384